MASMGGMMTPTPLPASSPAPIVEKKYDTIHSNPASAVAPPAFVPSSAKSAAASELHTPESEDGIGFLPDELNLGALVSQSVLGLNPFLLLLFSPLFLLLLSPLHTKPPRPNAWLWSSRRCSGSPRPHPGVPPARSHFQLVSAVSETNMSPLDHERILQRYCQTRFSFSNTSKIHQMNFYNCCSNSVCVVLYTSCY